MSLFKSPPKSPGKTSRKRVSEGAVKDDRQSAPIPTSEQLAILDNSAVTRILDAAAGTGKTTTLALCLARALQQGVRPEHCLYLTKTDAAVGAARQALAKVGIAATQRADIAVQTIEQLARAALFRLEGQPVPGKLSPEQLAENAWAAMSLALKRMSDATKQAVEVPLNDGRARDNRWIDPFFDELCRIRGSLAHIDEAGEFVPRREMQESLDQLTLLNGLVFRAYTQDVRQANLNGEPPMFRTEGDATFDLARCLRQGGINPASGVIPAHFAWVVLDEMHDINAACFEVISAIIAANPACRVIAVGDLDQVIFGADGADACYMDSAILQEAWQRPVTRGGLTGSFRFGPALSLVVNRLLPGKCKPAGAVATAVHFFDQQETVLLKDETLLKVLADFQAAKPASTAEAKSLAIVLRHPSQLLAIESVLIEQELPYALSGFDSCFSWPAVNLIRGVLAVAGLRFDETTGSRETRRRIIHAFDFFAKPSFSDATLGELPSRDAYLAQCAKQAQDSEAVLVSFFERFLMNQAADGSRCDEVVSRWFREGVAAIRKVGANVTVQQVAKEIHLDALILHAISSSRVRAQTSRNVQAIADMAQGHGSALAYFRLLSSLETRADTLHQANINKTGSDRPVKSTQKKRQITIYQVDASKGREFSHVYVPHLDRHVFPFDAADPVEERNRLYVAISRAKQALYLSAHVGLQSELYLRLRGDAVA